MLSKVAMNQYLKPTATVLASQLQMRHVAKKITGDIVVPVSTTGPIVTAAGSITTNLNDKKVDTLIHTKPHLRTLNTNRTMKASILQNDMIGIKLDNFDMPRIMQPNDVVVQLQKTTICGTDLHISNNKVDTAHAGVVMGHEGIGTIIECGPMVTQYQPGDRVLIPCITKCGYCSNCLAEFHGHCSNGGGWIMGHKINGMQAEFVRVPHADKSLYRLPENCTPELENKLLMCADILPTAYEIGLLDGHMNEDKTVAIVGTGPVGLAALLLASSIYPAAKIIAIDRLTSRLEKAVAFGANQTIEATSGEETVNQIMNLTEGLGVDLAVECVGVPAAWYTCQDIVRAGGHIALLGVHGDSATLNLERMWKRNFTLTAGMVHCHTIDELMGRIQDGSLDSEQLISDSMNLSEVEDAYSKFLSRVRPGSSDPILKIILENDISAPL